MKGILVVNGFLNSNKFNEIYSYLKTAFEEKGHKIKVYTNIELSVETKLGELDFILFWDKDIYLAKSLEKMGYRVFNSASGIESCDNKALTYLKLKGKVKMPKTIVAPMTFKNIGYSDLSFVEEACKKLKLPIVIKECFGSFGQQVYLARDVKEAKKIVQNTSEPLIFQEYISKSCGQDIRINMVGQEAVASMLRFNPNDFRANITNGGQMFNYEPSEEEVEMAREVMEHLGLDFAGVDILFGEKGPILCEVNSNAHFKNIYDCTGVNVAECIVEYIEKCLDI